MRSMRPGLVLAASVAGAVAFAACSHDTEADTRTPPTEQPPSASPLSDTIGYDPVLGIWNGQALQDDVADCMQSLGFDYSVQATDDEQNDLTLSEADAQSVGYGITVAFLGGDQTTAPTPQDQYVAGLSDTERAAYESALYDDAAGSAGCLTDAQHRFYGAGPDGAVPLELENAISDIRDRVASNPAVIQAEADWSTCMTSAGYEYPNRAAARADIQGQLDAITGLTTSNQPQVVSANESMMSAAADLRSVEILTATADTECATETDLDKTIQEATNLEETNYLDEHPGFNIG